MEPIVEFSPEKKAVITQSAALGEKDGKGVS